jgi:hypothetical protein
MQTTSISNPTKAFKKFADRIFPAIQEAQAREITLFRDEVTERLTKRFARQRGIDFSAQPPEVREAQIRHEIATDDSQRTLYVFKDGTAKVGFPLSLEQQKEKGVVSFAGIFQPDADSLATDLTDRYESYRELGLGAYAPTLGLDRPKLDDESTRALRNIQAPRSLALAM